MVDVVILSLGSLFTSTIRALLGAGVREALASFAEPVGERDDPTRRDHRFHRLRLPPSPDEARWARRHRCARPFGDLPRELVARYAVEEATPVEVDQEEVERLGVRLREADLFSDEVGTSIRRDPNRLAKEVCKRA